MAKASVLMTVTFEHTLSIDADSESLEVLKLAWDEGDMGLVSEAVAPYIKGDLKLEKADRVSIQEVKLA